jgi:serine phosphatase RsbU (regulator of sigma subunit)
MPTAKYWDVAMRLDPGDKVLLFMDGITEATNPRGEEYGENRLHRDLISMNATLPRCIAK